MCKKETIYGCLVENMNRVCIFIPTFNRPDFLRRQLLYYASVGSRSPVFVADGSESCAALVSENFCRAEGKKFPFKLQYRKFPEISEFHSFALALREIQEPYVAFIGDDDFQFPASFSKVADFLDANPSYASAHGAGVVYSLFEDHIDGRLADFLDYRQISVGYETAAERVYRFFLDSYYTPFFALTRLSAMRRAFFASENVRDRTIGGELIPAALVIAAGKSFFFKDQLGFARQVHPDRYILPNHEKWRSSSVYQEGCEAFVRSVGRAISESDQIAVEEAEIIARKCLAIYVERSLNKKPPSLRISMRSKLRNIPFLSHTYRYLKSRLKLRAIKSGKTNSVLHPVVARDFHRLYENGIERT